MILLSSLLIGFAIAGCVGMVYFDTDFDTGEWQYVTTTEERYKDGVWNINTRVERVVTRSNPLHKRLKLVSVVTTMVSLTLLALGLIIQI